MTRTEVEVAKRRLADIDRRRAEIEFTLRRERVGTYRRQELEAELTDLVRTRVITDTALRTGAQAPVKADKRRQALVDAWVAERSASIRFQIERFEAQGDHRQARIWRMELLQVREQVEAQLT